MTDQEIQETFERFFEKYKKTEGDRSAWSAYWTDQNSHGVFEIVMTKCPRGTVFKPYADKRKLTEYVGWETFLEALPELEREQPALDREAFFNGMRDIL
ncbi:hypothetical protein SAMN02745704_02421 [Paucidesulfovibrio gracilis DSM 16080]|uniref:Uncharacterized protein n=1 Tax=Paucidesulfovibrio gracilis DSM 16080 TaxID=1121449 RepID=A0A1T4XU30_9BACT|nr:hypothetical protein [Paucidesulfovibrio gracilis]SKA92561.1 hypothetical protein SAMN02745704_02421 [Paucidesulfovibrio gracilis DSM 16080]